METRPPSQSDRDSVPCANCGTVNEPSARFCGNCGVGLAAPIVRDAPSRPAPALDPDSSYYIPAQRVIVMMALSSGLYLFYWLYITWKQYQEHTGDAVYPVWHALTRLVPVYGLFRIYAHMRAFRYLMDSANIPSSILPGPIVFIVLMSDLSNVMAFLLNGQLSEEPVSQAMSNFALTVNILSIAFQAGVLWIVQRNLNVYWMHLNGGPLPPARVWHRGNSARRHRDCQLDVYRRPPFRVHRPRLSRPDTVTPGVSGANQPTLTPFRP